MKFLLEIKFREIYGFLRSLTPAQTIRISSYIFILTLFLIGAYAFFLRIFLYLSSLPEIGELLTERLLETALLVFFTMLLLSSLITSLSTLYHSKEVEFLISKPIPVKQIFNIKFTENCAYSSWATFLLMFPLLLALSLSHRAPLFFLPSAILSTFSFIIIPTSLGVAILVILRMFFPNLTPIRLLLLISFTSIVGIILFFVFGQPKGISVQDITTMEELTEYLYSLGVVTSPLFPSNWFSKTLLSSLHRNFSDSIFFLACLFSTALFSLVFVSIISSKMYLNTFFISLEHVSKRKKIGNLQKYKFLKSHVSLPSSFALIEKDLTLFFRSPTQWAQGAIILSLLIIYMGSLHNYPMFFDFPFWKTLIAFVNFSFVAYVMSILSTRFVFPAISLEGQTLWLIRSSPLSVKRLLLEKTALSTITSLILGETLVLLSNFLLKTDLNTILLSALGIFLLSISLSSISVSFGALLPEFKERNPGKIASGAGGILTAVACLTLVAITVSLAAYPTYHFVTHKFHGSSPPLFSIIISSIIILILHILSTIVPFLFAVHTLRRRDY